MLIFIIIYYIYYTLKIILTKTAPHPADGRVWRRFLHMLLDQTQGDAGLKTGHELLDLLLDISNLRLDGRILRLR